MGESAGDSTSNRIDGDPTAAVLAHTVGPVTFNQYGLGAAGPDHPPPGNGNRRIPIWAAAAVGLLFAGAGLVVVLDKADDKADDMTASPPVTSQPITPSTTSPSTSAQSAPTASPQPPGSPIPLADVDVVDTPTFKNDLINFLNVDGVEAKVAGLSCANGTPAPVTEAYRLEDRFATFSTHVAVNTDPADAGPVTFLVLTDGTVVDSMSVPVGRSELIDIDVAGVRVMTLQVSSTNCTPISVAWAEPTLSSR
jgi:hypothetical protein